MLPRASKKTFNNGVVIPVKMRQSNNCNGEILCNECNNRMNENKEFDANLNELKRHPPNEFGFMLPCYENNFKSFVLNHLLYFLVFFFLYYTH